MVLKWNRRAIKKTKSGLPDRRRVGSKEQGDLSWNDWDLGRCGPEARPKGVKGINGSHTFSVPHLPFPQNEKGQDFRRRQYQL